MSMTYIHSATAQKVFRTSVRHYMPSQQAMLAVGFSKVLLGTITYTTIYGIITTRERTNH